MTNTPRPSLAAQGSDAVGAALAATTQALDSGKQFATEAAGRIGETARGVRESAADFTRTSAESLGQAAGAARHKLGDYASAARRYVGEEPVKAALIGAAVGVAAAMLVMMVTGRMRDPK